MPSLTVDQLYSGQGNRSWRNVPLPKSMKGIFYVEVGLMESDSMEVDPNRRMRDALSAKGELVGYSEFDGGHSFLNWSGGMVNGLENLTRPSKSKDDSSSD